MDPRFNSIFSSPANEIFKVVFFPDRIYHAQYLNATRSNRYRYHVQEVRGYADINILKGVVYLDGELISSFLRIEYRASRLVEAAREKGRILSSEILGEVTLIDSQARRLGPKDLKLQWDSWINSYQVELWSSLDPPPFQDHDYSVLDMMGYGGSITRIKDLAAAIQSIGEVTHVEIRFREPKTDFPSGEPITDPVYDNNFTRSHQEPRSAEPSAPENTVKDDCYYIDFKRTWHFNSKSVAPVRYRNAMMGPNNPRANPNNIIEMRWLLQRELGGTNVFFHEVTLPPGTVEGAHQHIGSEELYYVTNGEGFGYTRDKDDPDTGESDMIELDVLGIGPKLFRKTPIGPGSLIFTKSGGMHAIENNGDTDLRFVAILYHQ